MSSSSPYPSGTVVLLAGTKRGLFVLSSQDRTHWNVEATALSGSGTAAGALITGHPYIAGAAITAAWLAATWRGIHHLRLARTPAPPLPNSRIH